MAAFEAEGKLYKKMDTQQVTDTFKKREFVVEMVDGAYTQLVKFQMVQNNCEKLDGFNEGDDVKVTFNLRGREWTSPQGEVKYFSTLDAWKIDAQSAAPAQQAAPVSAPAPASMPSPTDAPPAAQSNDDLPF
jgi:translation initiation factor IF-3